MTTPLAVQLADTKLLEPICRTNLVKSTLNLKVTIFRFDDCRGKITSLILWQK